MVIIEKSFPRGGIAETSRKRESNGQATEHITFGARQKKFKKLNKKINEVPTESDEQAVSSSAETLNYSTVQEGMNIMGIVQKIDHLYLMVALPGRMVARVSVLDISNSYTSAVKSLVHTENKAEGYYSLFDLYKIDQVVYGRIQELKQTEHGRTLIDMSLKPSCVHSELHHESISKGFIFSGSIKSMEDHGYIIESGIKGSRCFLPYDKSKMDLVVGQSVFLKVIKSDHDKNISTYICKRVDVHEVMSKFQHVNLDYLLPSTIVKFRVKKILRNGVQGTILNDMFVAYANEHHLMSPLTFPNDLDVDSTYNARILYIMPLTKFVFVSLNLYNEKDFNKQNAQTILKRGDIIENAKVHHAGTAGIVLVLNEEQKGILSYKMITMNYKSNYDQDVLMKKYSKDSLHKVRIVDYDKMDSLYICCDNAKTLNEKYFNLDDLKPGEYVTAIIQQFNEKIGGYNVKIGKHHGIIGKLYLASSTKHLEVGAKIQCRVIYTSVERGTVYLTNRSEYMDKNCKILKNFNDAHVNAKYMGTIVNCSDSNVILIKFFGETSGVLYKNNTNGAESLMEGQTLLFRVASKKNGQLQLSLLESDIKYGEISPVKVIQNLESGLEVDAVYCSNNDTECVVKGLIPIRLLSDFENLLLAKLSMFSVGDELKAVSLSNNIFSLRDVEYIANNTLKWCDVKHGDILKAYIHNVTDDGDVVELKVALADFQKSIKLHVKMLLMNAVNLGNITLNAQQIIYVKVLSKVDVTETLSVSGKLMDVWQGKLDLTAQYIERYLKEIKTIKDAFVSKGKSISYYSIGQKVTAQFQCVDECSSDWIYVLGKTKVVGLIKSTQVSKLQPPNAGEQQDCIILWIDYSNNIIYLSNKLSDCDHICDSGKLPKKLFKKFPYYHEAKVLYKDSILMICSLKKRNYPIIYCPVRLYYNDLEEIGGATIVEGDFCKLAFIHPTLPIAVTQHVFKLYNDAINKKKTDHNKISVKVPKRKLKENVQKDTKKQKIQKVVHEESVEENSNVVKTDSAKKCGDSSSELFFYEDKTSCKEVETHEVQPLSHKDSVKSKNFKIHIKEMPNVSCFWELPKISNNEAESSEDELENCIQNQLSLNPKEKKKLSATEKFKLEREEEARLRAIEEKYSDPKQIPDTVDQFDRLVLSEPDNSKCWINYMAFHLQSSEIDKARSVARRAIKTISYRNTPDRINIWVALLNLEIRYGGKEIFEDTLKEALLCNDQKSIYSRVLEILSEAQKTTELLELIPVVIRKFGATEIDIWRSIGNALFNAGLAEKAQQLLQKSLTSLPERDHITAIVTFANLNYKHGFNELAHTLLDQVVSSYPKRVDVWSQYVDMLIKDDLIDSARNVLERAILQTIPLRKMRTIFKKYVQFEERYGDDTKVHRVKQLAVDFVNKNAHL